MKWENQRWQVLLEELRSLPMTLEEIGLCINVGRSHVCKMIKGDASPSRRTFQAIADLHKANLRSINKSKRYKE